MNIVSPASRFIPIAPHFSEPDVNRSLPGTLSLIRVAASDGFIPSDDAIDELFPKMWGLIPD
jgi:hypothetical protein